MQRRRGWLRRGRARLEKCGGDCALAGCRESETMHAPGSGRSPHARTSRPSLLQRQGSPGSDLFPAQTEKISKEERSSETEDKRKKSVMNPTKSNT
ncbi:unnamed protein product [Caretta caretta]